MTAIEEEIVGTSEVIKDSVCWKCPQYQYHCGEAWCEANWDRTQCPEEEDEDDA